MTVGLGVWCFSYVLVWVLLGVGGSGCVACYCAVGLLIIVACCVLAMWLVGGFTCDFELLFGWFVLDVVLLLWFGCLFAMFGLLLVVLVV